MSDALIIPVDSSQVEKGKRSLADLAAQGKKTEQAIDGLGKAGKEAGAGIGAIAKSASLVKVALGGLAAFGLASLTKESIVLASRYNELGIVMKVVGQNAGFTSAQLNAQEVALRKTGISMLESRSNITKLIAANIDLSKSAQLARLAQDAAVIGGLNSSEAFARLTVGIQTAQTETLRTLGLNVSFENSYKKLAATLGKTTDDLTEFEKTQARVNEVLNLAPTIAGAYEASLDNAGKQIRSSTRYLEDLKVQLGQTFNEALTVAVLGFTQSLKDANGEVSELAANGQLKKWGEGVLDVMAFVADSVRSVGTTFQLAGSNIAEFIALRSNGIDTFLGGGLSAGIKQAGEEDRAQISKSASMFRDALAERRKALSDKKPIDPILEQGLADAGFNETFLRIEAEAQLAIDAKKTKAREAADKSYASQQESIRESIKLLQQENRLIIGGETVEEARTIARLRAGTASDAQIVTILNLTNAQKQLAEALEAEESFYAEFEKTLESQQAARDAQLESITKSAVQLELENLTYGKLPSAITEVALATLEKSKADAISIGLIGDNIEAIDEQIAALKRLQSAQSGNERLDAEKKANDERVKADKEANDKIQKQHEELSKDINKSLTDALLRGFESGKGFAQNFRDTLINMFKTLVLRPTIEAILKPVAGGLTGILGGLFSGNANAAGAGKVLTGTGSDSIFGQLSGIKDIFSSGNNAIVNGIGSLGQSLSSFGSGGTGFIRDIASSIGSFTQLNSSLISNIAPFAGAALQLIKGDFKGAALTGIGTLLGGPIGGAIGGLVGSVFGKKKIKRFGTSVSGAFDGETFKETGRGKFYDKDLGAADSLTALSGAFSSQLGGFLNAFKVDSAFTTSASQYQRGKSKKSGGSFGVGINGENLSFSVVGKKLSPQAVFDMLTDKVFGAGLATAISKSKVVEGIRTLFDGLTDKAVVASLILATTSLNAQEVALNKNFGLTVDVAGKVVKASGAAGQGLADFATKLAAIAQSTQTVGDVLVKSRADIGAQLGNIYGDIVTDAITSTVTRQVPIAATAALPRNNALVNLGLGGFGALGGNGSTGFNGGGLLGIAGINSNLLALPQQFQTITEQVTTYVDRIVAKTVALPQSLAEYDAAIKAINTTTAQGIKQVADLIALRDSFGAYTQAIDGLKAGVAGATFDLRSPVEQARLRQAEIDKIFNGLNIATPKDIAELLALADGINYTTEAGANLAAALPTLRNLFDAAADSVDDLTKSLESLRAGTLFKTQYDYDFYKGIANNYGSDFANQYIDGAKVNYAASNNTSANIPLNISPNNNTTISTSDPAVTKLLTTLVTEIKTLKPELVTIKANTESSAKTLRNASRDDNAFYTKAAA